jgi:hypothetical protein
MIDEYPPLVIMCGLPRMGQIYNHGFGQITMRKILAVLVFLALFSIPILRPAIAGPVGFWVPMIAWGELKLMMAILGALCLIVAAMTAQRGDV